MNQLQPNTLPQPSPQGRSYSANAIIGTIFIIGPLFVSLALSFACSLGIGMGGGCEPMLIVLSQLVVIGALIWFFFVAGQPDAPPFFRWLAGAFFIVVVGSAFMETKFFGWWGTQMQFLSFVGVLASIMLVISGVKMILGKPKILGVGILIIASLIFILALTSILTTSF